jgi:lysophospholipase L1-like esterase
MEQKRTLYVLGDSIAYHYGPYLRRLLDETFEIRTKEGDREAGINLDRPAGANGGDSGRVLAFLQEQAGGSNSPLGVDYMLLNCGLHDIKRDPETMEPLVELEDYKANLDHIFTLIGQVGIQAVWVHSTPVPDERHNVLVTEFKRYNQDIVRYNAAAKEAAERYRIPQLDLYSFSCRLGGAAYCDHIHYTEEARYLQASYIAGFVSGVLA